MIATSRHLLRARDVIDSRYGEPLDVPALAAVAHVSTDHFTREFRRVFGETPHQYLLTRRMERAGALLRSTDHSVTDICGEVGLTSLGSFTTSFRRVYRSTPMSYRASYPPPESMIRIPACVAKAYGRPANRTFREVSDERVPVPSRSSTPDPSQEVMP